jgi:hypothetical protein
MRLVRASGPWDHPDWIFELKYDGFRSLAYVGHERVRFVSRKNVEYKRFRDLGKSIGAVLRGREVAVAPRSCLTSSGLARPSARAAREIARSAPGPIRVARCAGKSLSPWPPPPAPGRQKRSSTIRLLRVSILSRGPAPRPWPSMSALRSGSMPAQSARPERLRCPALLSAPRL